jgi:translation elongation factor EF-Tu-like GTPase
MSGDPRFRMVVEDVFFIRGRGVAVTGQLESGALSVGDEVYIAREASSRHTSVTGIELLGKQVRQAQPGDKLGVLLADISTTEVERGDVLMGSVLDFSWKP